MSGASGGRAKHCLLALGLFVGASGLLVAGGCTSNYIDLPHTIQRPGKINMAGLDKIAVVPIQGPGGALMTAQLKEAIQAKGLQIIDLQPAAGAETGTDTIARIEARLVQQPVCQHQIQVGQVIRNRVKSVAYQDTATATLKYSFDIKEVPAKDPGGAAKRVLHTEIFQSTQTRVSDLAPTPPRLPEAPLYDECSRAIVASVMEALAPYEERTAIKLYRSELPDAKAAVAMFGAKNYGEAAKAFESAIAKSNGLEPKQVAQLRHNLGVAHEFNNKLDLAKACLDQTQPDLGGEEPWRASMWRYEQRMKDREKAKQQGLAPPTTQSI